MLYSISIRNAAKLKFCDNKSRIARYGAPVQGSSTPATKTPRIKTPGKVIFFVISCICFALSGGIIKLIPCQYQKKSFISIMPAMIMSEPTTIEIYSLIYKGTELKKYNMPKPANK